MPDENSHQNGWNEYSRLVLKELETLADGIDSLRTEIQSVNQELAKMQVREDKVDDLKQWKERIDDVLSPSQLKDLVKEMAELKSFKVKAITIFAVVQFSMVAIAWALKVF
jgi:hypothetical protein